MVNAEGSVTPFAAACDISPQLQFDLPCEFSSRRTGHSSVGAAFFLPEPTSRIAPSMRILRATPLVVRFRSLVVAWRR